MVRLSGQLNLHAHFAVQLRRNVDTLYIQVRARLQRDRLPQSAGLDVPVLLAVRDFVVEHFGEARAPFPLVRRRVCDAHGQLVRARTKRVGHVEDEGRVAALVRAYRFSVDEDFGEVVARAEAQERAPTLPRPALREMIRLRLFMTMIRPDFL
jgi:hypothetical protein